MIAFRFLVVLIALPWATATAAWQDDWVERSNEHAQVLLEVMARFGPEQAGDLGIEGLDHEVFQLPLDGDEQMIAAMTAARDELVSRLEEERHPAVRQDLQILIDAAESAIESEQLAREYSIPYFNLHEAIFSGVRHLLHEQMPPERWPAALVRLRKYAGQHEGYDPITEQAEALIRARLEDPALRGPYVDSLRKDLGNASRFVDGLQELLEERELEGWEETLDQLRGQLDVYEQYLREELLPRATDDFRLPAELYAHALVEVGVDMSTRELVSRAKVAFREIQNQMQALAPIVAEQHGLDVTDYRDVIRALKGEPLVGEIILAHYEDRNAQLEELIERHGIVTLPDRELQIRLASEAESAQIPAPHMRPPRLLGNTGEVGQFILPLSIPDASGDGELKFDDFTFEAASWTLSAHEARPGHELQFAAVIEQGVSIARALFAFNSVNVEGWALYMEAELQPYEPPDGQLIALQHRLLRAARAFLDPGLQLGTLDTDTAYRVLQQDVVLSSAMAMQEVERYTFWAPAQATAYFCGYTRLMELRTDTELLLGDRFDRKAFHDFILAQGLLPPALLRKAVMDEFVPR